MTVHAHPDDEAIYTGGILAHYSSLGVRTSLVTCTRGEEGQIGVADLKTSDNAGRLGDLREAELRCSIRALGISSYYQLGYRDSGVQGSPSNKHPDSFYQADISEAIGRLVRIVRQERPDVLVSYDEKGDYGHPDHVKAHKITSAAFQYAGDDRAYPEMREPCQPRKLYYCYLRPSLRLKAMREMRERGIKTPLDEPGFDEGQFRDDPRARTVVDAVSSLQRKLEALLCHRTQVDIYGPIISLPQEFLREFAGYESFILAKSLVAALGEDEAETDLFRGIG
jgi:N-acetyl-1-D-myo-inositol-2-amino-2-deoxy-alpha-D-glucopyranoside deacetylase